MLDLSLSNNLFIENEIDAAIQELDILFSTEPSELIGYPEYGCIFENYLWELTPSPESLKHYIDTKIQGTYFLKNLDYQLDVNYNDYEDEYIYYIKIDIYSNGEKVKDKIYEIKNYNYN